MKMPSDRFQKESLIRLALRLWRLPRPKLSLPKKRVVASVALMAFLLIGLGLSLQLTQKKQKIQKAAGSDVLLSLNPSQTTAAPGDNFTVTTYINDSASNYHISAVDFAITYPSSQLTLTKIDVGSFFGANHNPPQTEMLKLGVSCLNDLECRPDVDPVKNSLKCWGGICTNLNTNTPSNTPGSARIILGAPCTTASPWQCFTPTGTGQLAVLHFLVKSNAPPGQAAIGFGPSSASATEFASSGGQGVNVLDTNQLNPIAVTISSPATPTPNPQKASLYLKVKFEGINSARPDGTKIRVIFKQGGSEVNRLDNLNVNPGPHTDGTFEATITNLEPGTNDVFIKGWAHLQRKFSGINLVAGQTASLDGTGNELLAGDITGVNNQPPDNRVDGADFSIFISTFNPFAPAVPGTLADLDLNGFVNGGDFALLVGNFNPFGGGEE